VHVNVKDKTINNTFTNARGRHERTVLQLV